MRWLAFHNFNNNSLPWKFTICSRKRSISSSSTTIDMEVQLAFSTKMVGRLEEEARSEEGENYLPAKWGI